MAWLAEKGRWKSVLVIGALVAMVIAVVQANPAVRAKYSAILASNAGLKVGQFPNSALEQYALTKVNSNGGSCRTFVNNVVAAVSHGGINIAYDEDNYFQPFIDNGAIPVTSVAQLAPGDIVQQGQTDSFPDLHTFIIVSRVSVSGSTGSFVVVDSNHDYDDVVHTYTRTGVTIDNSSIRAYRLGYVTSSVPASSSVPPAASGGGKTTGSASPSLQGSSPSLQGGSPSLQGSSPSLQGGADPQSGGTSSSPPKSTSSSGGGGSTVQQPTSTPTPSVAPQPQPVATTYAETPGSVAHTWTDYADAGGSEGPSIASGQTVQISCRLNGFQVADGNTAWYRIASAPWSGQYYVSADAFYNDGRTSGSLSGTPFYDPAVPVC
jgi:hypothetical protein